MIRFWNNWFIDGISLKCIYRYSDQIISPSASRYRSITQVPLLQHCDLEQQADGATGLVDLLAGGSLLAHLAQRHHFLWQHPLDSWWSYWLSGEMPLLHLHSWVVCYVPVPDCHRHLSTSGLLWEHFAMAVVFRHASLARWKDLSGPDQIQQSPGPS